jgi:hypothetical protein
MKKIRLALTALLLAAPLANAAGRASEGRLNHSRKPPAATAHGKKQRTTKANSGQIRTARPAKKQSAARIDVQSGGASAQEDRSLRTFQHHHNHAGWKPRMPGGVTQASPSSSLPNSPASPSRPASQARA